MARYSASAAKRPAGRPLVRHQANESELIIRQTTERLLEAVALHDITVDVIADAATVSRSTFYKYFGSKYSVIASLLESVMDEINLSVLPSLERRADVSPVEALREALIAMTGVWSKHRALLRAVSENWHIVPELDEQWNYLWDLAIDAMSELLDHERAAGHARPGPPSRQVASALLWSAERALYVAGLGDNPDMPSEEAIVESFVTIWYNALYNAPPLSHPATGQPLDIEEQWPVRATPSLGPGSPAVSRPSLDSASDERTNGPSEERQLLNESEALICAATERLLADVPLHDLTVALISDTAGVSRQTFYTYFPSKYAVITALMEAVMQDIIDSTAPFLDRDTAGGSAADALRTSFDAATDVWFEHRMILRAASENWRVVPELKAQWTDLWDRAIDTTAELMDRQRAAGVSPPGPPSRQVASVIMWGAERALYIAGLQRNPDMNGEKSVVDTLVTIWHGAFYGSTTTSTPAPARDQARNSGSASG
jgi:TetR/AcrR family transcriptional regulator, ethionamide resistance regulator